MQRIEVKNFGPLKDVSLDIKDYMIFIGPQASGKSTLAKLVWFFDEIAELYETIHKKHIISLLLRPNENQSERLIIEFKLAVNDLFSEYFGGLAVEKKVSLKATYADDSYIMFELGVFQYSPDFFTLTINPEQLGDIPKVNLSLGNDSFPLSISDFNKLEEALPAFIPKDAFTQIIQKVNNQNHLLIPAVRSIITELSNSISFIDSGTLNPITVKYVKFINQIRKKFRLTKESQILQKKSVKFDFNEYPPQKAIELSNKVLKGSFIHKDNRDGIWIDDNIFIDINNASSGQQEAVWLINIIFYFLLETEEVNIIIEEPEAHLFPEAQRDLTYLISLLANQQGNQVLLTTHSPYILASLNNLLKAYTVGQAEKNKEAVGKIIDPLLWVDPARVFVGYMENGEIKPILNPELQQIEHDLLDNVSNDIMAKFDELLEIQYNQ